MCTKKINVKHIVNAVPGRPVHIGHAEFIYFFITFYQFFFHVALEASACIVNTHSRSSVYVGRMPTLY